MRKNIYEEESNRESRKEAFEVKLTQKHKHVKLVGKYTNNSTKTDFYCEKHNHYFKSDSAHVLKNKYCCAIGMNEDRRYGAFTKESYQERLRERNKYLEITSDYVNAQTKITFKCNKCGVWNQIANPNSLLRRDTHCGVCNSSRKLVVGYTDLYTIHSQYLPYFQNEEDAKTVKYGSLKVMEFKCPICGHKKNLKVAQLTSKGFGCPKCGDGTSYPNRFMFNLLEQLKIDFDNEVKFDWSQNRRYDFIVNKTLIEMDGGFHKGSKFSSKEENQRIDKLKDDLAKSNGYDIIRIECYESRFELIKENIINSELSELLDLSKIDWVELEKNLITDNLVKRASEVFNEYKGIKSIDEMAKILNMRTTRLCPLLKTSARIGLTDYDAKLSLGGFYTPNKENTNSKKAICLETGKIYNSCLDAEKELGSPPDSVARVCRGERLTVRGFHFDFIETTDEIQEKKNKMKESESKPSHSSKRVLCIELDKMFESSEEATKFCGKSKGYVSNLMRKNRKTKEGYTFKYI